MCENRAETLTEKWEDLRTIENLIGRAGYYLLNAQENQIWNTVWCREHEPCLGFNHGYYKGIDAVENWYAARNAEAELKASLVQKAYPEKLGGRDSADLLGVGTLDDVNVTTPLIEIAEDGKTAKGLWSYMNTYLGFTQYGMDSYHYWGRIGADFIRESDGWKLWHLLVVEDFKIPTGGSWLDSPAPRQTSPEFTALSDIQYPEPSVSADVYDSYHPERVQEDVPAIPVPYVHFEDTFSYGI